MRRGAATILHVFSSGDIGGVEVRTRRLIDLLGEHYRHAALTLQDADATAALRRLMDGIEWLNAPPRARTGPTVLRLLHRLHRLRFDLIATYGWGAMDMTIAAALQRRTPCVHHEDEWTDAQWARPPRRRRWARRLVLPRLAAVVVPSRMLESHARNAWRVPANKVHYIPNGVAALPVPRAAGLELRRQLGLEGDDRAALVVARLVPQKTICRAIAAVALTPYHLIIAGEGPERSRLAQETRMLGVEDRVHFLGWASEMQAVFAAGDVYLSTSSTEQHSLALLEAMAAGMPVVSTETGEERSTLPLPQHEFLVPTDASAEYVAQRLIRLVEDHSLAQAMGAANLEEIVTRFSPTIMAAQYSSLFDTSIHQLNRRRL